MTTADENNQKTAKLLPELLKEGRLMQIATTSGDQPWICTVYYVADTQHNLYWLSFPTRRHSQEIANNRHIAIAIAIKHDKPVIGIQAEGSATAVTDPNEVKEVMQNYVAKYNQGKDFYNNYKSGTNRHVLYKFTPNNYVLFNELHFDGDGRQASLKIS